jgi:hypothetical protein
MIRSSSMERLSTPEMGLLISCATLAASWPRDASRSMSGFQLFGPLRDARFEQIGGFVQLAQRRPEPHPHDVERFFQLLQLLTFVADRNGLIEIHLGDGLGSGDQVADGNPDKPADEQHDHASREENLEYGGDDDIVAHVRGFLVQNIQTQRNVQDA